MDNQTPPTIAGDSFLPRPISAAGGRVRIRDDAEFMVGNSHRHPWKASYPCLIPIMLCFCLLTFE
jgi:hypothetical protein